MLRKTTLLLTCCLAAGQALGQDAADSQQIFRAAGARLTDDLARLTQQASASTVLEDAGSASCSLDNCGDGCGDECGEGCGEGCGLFGGKDTCFEIGGWMQFGYHSRDGLIRFNSTPHRFNLHQGWLFAEKEADGSCGLDWGFRFDAMYGIDAADTQAFGNPSGSWDYENGFDHGAYGWALPQAYLELAKGDFSVQIGHFFTLIGYEVVTAPDNFFYSHAFTMYNSEPFTHTGVLGTYNASDDVTLYAGWTAGWDTGFDRKDGGSNFLGGASLALTESATFTYITTIGDFGDRGEGYSHSLVLDVAVNDKLNYIIQSDLMDADGNFPLQIGNRGVGVPTPLDDHQIGINQYLIYSINDKLAAGTRLEWWNVDGISVNDVTFGLNIKPCDSFILRPELRHDWAPGLDYAESFFGVDAILTF